MSPGAASELLAGGRHPVAAAAASELLAGKTGFATELTAETGASVCPQNE